MKENKKRITFWFIVFLIFTSLSIYGMTLYNSGHGKYGIYKKILDPIVLEFNTLPDVARLSDINAKVSKDAIVVTYTNASNKKEKFEYKYGKSNNIEYITGSDSVGSSMWQFISFQLINAVYHLNGGTGSVLEEYNTKTFTQTSLEEGVTYQEASKSITINIATNYVNNIKGKYESLKDDQYVKDSDLDGLMNTLKSDGKFKVDTGDITLYVTENNTQYDIYTNLNDNNKDRVYKSIAAVVKILDSDVYSTLLNDSGEIIILESGKRYETVNNSVFSETDVFDKDAQIFDFILYKK